MRSVLVLLCIQHCFRAGLVLVLHWFCTGFALVLGWFCTGFGLVLGWFRNDLLGSLLAPASLQGLYDSGLPTGVLPAGG
jgi:hypothetical protein